MSESLSKEDQKEMSKERSLLRLAERVNANEKLNTWGVIIDSSEPYEKDAEGNYAMKIKIVDQSFNFEADVNVPNLTFKNYATVYVFSNSKDLLPIFFNMGDIIRLRRFSWSITEKNHELIGNSKKFSNWMIFNGKDKHFKIISRMSIPKNTDRQVSQLEKDTITKLRAWLFDFFSKNTIRRISWWKKLAEVNENYHKWEGKIFENVDLILKLVDINEEEKKITFIDEKENKYLHFSLDLSFKINDVMKIRAATIKIESQKRVLIMTNSTSALKIHSEFIDARAFDPVFYEANYHLLEPKSVFAKSKFPENNFPTKQSVIDTFPYLTNYYFEEHIIQKRDLIFQPNQFKISSSSLALIKKDYCNRIPVQLANFVDINSNSLEKLRFQKFVLKVKIIDFDVKEMSEVFYTFCRSCFEAKPFFSVKNYICCEKPLYICYFFKIFVRDSSLTRDQNVPIYVLAKTQKENPFALWNLMPDLDNNQSWADYPTGHFDGFLNKLNAVKAKNEETLIVVQAKETNNGKFFLELGDTMFLP